MDSGQAADSVWCTPLANTSGGQRRRLRFWRFPKPGNHWYIGLISSDIWEQLLRVPAAVTSVLDRLQLARDRFCVRVALCVSFAP
eukprot:6939074-Prymnesium_polylepis.1